MAIHKLRKLGEDTSGAKVGLELPRDDARLEGILDENGELTEQPHLAISRVADGEWKIERVDGYPGR